MPAIGDVFVTLRLEGSAFERGVAAAQAQAERIGRAAKNATTTVDGVGDAAKKSGHSFELGSQQLSRFASIAVEQVVPATEGSRTVMEGAFQSVGKLAGGYGNLAIVGGGVAAVIAGVLYSSMVGSKGAAQVAASGVNSLDDSILKLEKDIESNIAALHRWDTLKRFLTPSQGLNPPTNMEDISKHLADKGGLGPGRDFAPQSRSAADAIKAARDLIELEKGFKLLEDPAAGGLVKKLAEADAVALLNLEKEIKSFVATAALAHVDDPLQRMLIADAKATQALIDKINALSNVTDKERAGLLGTASFFGDKNQQAAKDQFSKTNAPGAAERLGISDKGLISGFKGIDMLTDDLKVFGSEIERLARKGVPARDLFNETADAQTRFDKTLVQLKEHFADTPAVFNQLIDLEKKYGNGGLQKALDDQVRSLQGLKQGAATTEDEMGNLIDKTFGKFSTVVTKGGEAGNYLAGVLYEDIPKGSAASVAAFDVVNGRLVTTTSRWWELAEAVHAASVQMVFNAGIVGVGQTSRVTGPGQ